MTARSRTLLLAAIISLLAACAPAAGAPTTPTPEPTDTPSPSATPSPTPSEAPTPTPAGSPAASPSQPTNTAFAADSVVAARVDFLRIRETPSLGGEQLGTIAIGSQSLVVDGPRHADGLEWYLISGLGIPFGSGCVTGPDPTNPYTCPVWLGWAARAAADGTPLLEEVEVQCPDPAGSLNSFAILPRYQYIACYGDEPLTLKGYLFTEPTDVPDDACPQVPAEQRWLGCVYATYQLVSGPLVDGQYPGSLGVVLTLAPGAGLPGDGGEIVVEGQFDHPAAADCTYGDEPGRSVLDCRAQFVVTSPGGYVGN